MSPPLIFKPHKPRSKYGNRKTVVDGVTFDSAAEARRFQELKLLERAGEIADLERQKHFPLWVNGFLVCTYIADAAYRDTRTGKPMVEDTKGMRTDVYILKRKLMKACHDIDILETTARRRVA